VSAPLLADTLFPNLSNIAQFPAPFSVDPSNKTPYSSQWNFGSPQEFVKTVKCLGF